MRPILDVAGLDLKRGAVTILRDIHWRIKPGEHWVVLGPNGCGKTSLLKALVGFFSPSAGRMTVLGRTYGRADWRDLRLQIGLVSTSLQASIPGGEPALDTVVSGRYAQLDLWAHPTSAETAAARRLLRQVGAGSLAERPWAYLSQGERQRVLIARALMARPRLLILDEPCAGLDPAARESFLQGVERLTRGRVAVVLVTHHVEEITPGFTHALVLREGTVLASGRVDRTVTSSVLSRAFAARVRVRRRGRRRQAEVEAATETHPLQPRIQTGRKFGRTPAPGPGGSARKSA